MRIHPSSLLAVLLGVSSPIIPAAGSTGSNGLSDDDRLLSPEQLVARDDLLSGVVTKKDVEIVLAHYAEDASWAAEYAPFVTLYSHGDPDDAHLPTEAKTIALEQNVGKESHAYLTHIVRNYDRLAEWTVFSQSGHPSSGYADAGGDGRGVHSGGHLVRGSVFEDYVLAYASGMESYFVASSAVEPVTLDHNIRSDFTAAGDGSFVRGTWGLEERCPSADSSLWMREWIVMSNDIFFKPFVAKQEQCGDSCPTLKEFAESMNIPGDFRDGHPIIFGQGARFAVSSQVLLRHPKSYYQALLEQVTGHPDPWQGYYMEYLWYQAIAADPAADAGHVSLCPETPSWDRDFHQSVVRLRATSRNLQGSISGGGVSGEMSRAVSGDMSRAVSGVMTRVSGVSGDMSRAGSGGVSLLGVSGGVSRISGMSGRYLGVSATETEEKP